MSGQAFNEYEEQLLTRVLILKRLSILSEANVQRPRSPAHGEHSATQVRPIAARGWAALPDATALTLLSLLK